jgi:hypothetical protein
MFQKKKSFIWVKNPDFDLNPHRVTSTLAFKKVDLGLKPHRDVFGFKLSETDIELRTKPVHTE